MLTTRKQSTTQQNQMEIQSSSDNIADEMFYSCSGSFTTRQSEGVVKAHVGNQDSSHPSLLRRRHRHQPSLTWNFESRSYNSLDKKWLNGHSMDNRSSSKIRSMRMMILILTGFLTFYFVIITSIGYQPKKLGSSASPASKPHSILDTLDQAKIKESEEGIKTTQTPKNTFEQNSPLYFRITGCLMLGVLIFTAVGVNRESPLMSMMSSIVCLCAVAQSVSNSMANIQISSPVFKYLIVSPAAFLGLLGVLLTIYTSLIWASEFETPPHVIEEYRWYLNQIRSEPAFTSPPQLQKPRLSGQGLFMKTHSRGNSSVASGEVTVEQHDLAASTNSYSSAKNH